MGPQTYNSLGSEVNLTVNRLPKSTNAEHIGDSNISDTGAVVSINSNTQITGSIRILSVTSSISTLTLINSSSVASPSTAPLLMFSASATNNYLISTNDNAFYVQARQNGFTDRCELGVGGLRIHNAASTPTVVSTGQLVLQAGSSTLMSAPSGVRIYNGTTGQLYVGAAVAPLAKIHIAGGSATANTAPLKFTAGTNLTTPESGSIEFDGTNLFFTPSTVRHTILTNTNPASITGNVSVTGNLSSTAKYILGSDLSLTPIAGNQSVLTSWWGLQIVGNKQSTVDYTPSAIGNNSDFSVIIPNQQAAKIGLIVRGQTSQTGNLLEFRNVSNTGLSAFDASGQLSLGKATPTAVLDVNGNTRITGSLNVTNGITGSLFGSASYATQALSASYAPGGATFPYNGNAQITGSLLVYGNSLVAGYNPTPLEGTIQDGVTSVLGDLASWDSNYYQGDVLYSETAGGTITFGQLCYRTQNNVWALADATSISATAINMLGICVKSSTSTNPTSILINGFVEIATYASVSKSGEPQYMATTAGSMTKTAPATAGNIVRLIGHTFWASNTNTKIIIRFNPENSWIEL